MTYHFSKKILGNSISLTYTRLMKSYDKLRKNLTIILGSFKNRAAERWQVERTDHLVGLVMFSFLLWQWRRQFVNLCLVRVTLQWITHVGLCQSVITSLLVRPRNTQFEQIDIFVITVSAVETQTLWTSGPCNSVNCLGHFKNVWWCWWWWLYVVSNTYTCARFFQIETSTASSAAVWNDLPAHVTAAPSFAISRQRLKTFLFSRSYPDIVT